MGLTRKLAKLEERAGALADFVPLDDGSKVTFPPNARFEALMWLLEEERTGEPPPLLGYLPRLAPDADEDLRNFASLCWALGNGPREAGDGA
ncbi:MAG: hypothetical protein M3N18_13080 [Actinomycetota bacterium]|nr:hypothetical protein [Actinomycetota bacterium]